MSTFLHHFILEFAYSWHLHRQFYGSFVFFKSLLFKTFYINIKTLFQSSFIFTIYYSFFMENRMHFKLHECILCLFQQFINRPKGWWRKKMIIWNKIKYKKVIGWWIINIGIAYTPTSIFFSLPFFYFSFSSFLFSMLLLWLSSAFRLSWE